MNVDYGHIGNGGVDIWDGSFTLQFGSVDKTQAVSEIPPVFYIVEVFHFNQRSCASGIFTF